VSLTLSSVGAFTAAVAAARSVDFRSYTLAGGRARAALVSAARAGAHVRVRLEGSPLDGPAGGLRTENAAAVAALTAAGADAALTAPDGQRLHMKAALVDGIAWLDDRNWTGDGRDTVLRDDDPADVAALTAAFDGRPGAAGALATTKNAALAQERAVIEAAGAPLAVETESFGSGTIADALAARARGGSPVRLLVAGREALAAGSAGDAERRVLDRLAALGVAVRTGAEAGKLAVTDGRAWTGSANATYAGSEAGGQADWGRTVGETALITGLGARFDADWAAGDPWAGPTPASGREARHQGKGSRGTY
jgi:phosphatidylserine/phosphatidylglycerophosphate/cardiolipin synthase-like enzyme